LHYVLQEWLNISYLLAANIDKPNRGSKIECPALEGLSTAFPRKEFPKPTAHTLSSRMLCCGAQKHKLSAGVGGKCFHKQRGRLPEPEHSILSFCQ